jgi:CelD/BcsL family acetyltransferase involved in cellulose biosynthesis
VISKKSWKHKEGVSISQQQGTRKFIYALTDLAAQQGWLLIWILRVNGIPVAMEYDLKYKGKVYALRSDFDDSYSQYSPGTYLQYKILKYLSEEKYCEYSFGPGLSSYKLHWTDKYRQNMVLYAHNDNIKGRITWVLKNKCIPFFKQIRNSLRKIGHPNT